MTPHLLSEKPVQALLKAWYQRWRLGNRSALVLTPKSVPALFPVAPDEFAFIEAVLCRLVKAGWLEHAGKTRSLRDHPRIVVPASRDGELEAMFGPPLQRYGQADVMWHPALSFARSCREGERLGDLLKINEWLLRNPDTTIRRPYRMQALEILGHEKAFDGKVRIEHEDLYEGALPLSVIGAYIPVMPIEPAVIDTESSVGLIVENQHSFAELVTWNEKAREFRAIVLGMGNQVLGTVPALASFADREGITQWQYFGDLDPAGLRIADKLTMRMLAYGQDCKPWLPGWEKLVDSEKRTPCQDGTLPDSNWLPANILKKATTLFLEGYRVPQEALRLH